MNTESFELSRSQHAVFRMEAFLSGHGFYLGGVARLRGPVSFDRLIRAAEKVGRSLDVFRVGFVADQAGTHWCGIRRDVPHTRVESVDFSPYRDSKQAFESWAQRQLLLKEDLSLAPIRLFAVRFSRDQSGWFCKAHHAAADAVALCVLMEHLAGALENEACIESPPFELLAERERIYENSRRMHRDAAYWRGVFGDCGPVQAARISCRYPIGDYRGLDPRCRRVRVELSHAQNETLARFRRDGGSVFRLFFAAVAHVQMVIEDGNGALLQAPLLNRWDEDERQTVAMAVAPVLIPVFREPGDSVADCYRNLEHRLKKAIVHSRCAPGTRWQDFTCEQWQQLIPVFGVSYQTGGFRKTVSELTVEIDHIQAVEALFATIHVHDRFQNGVLSLEADFRRLWSSDRCRAFLKAVVDSAMEAAAAPMEPASSVRVPTTNAVEPIAVYLRDAFERYADHVLFKVVAGTAGRDLSYREGAGWIRGFVTSLRDMRGVRSSDTPLLLLGRRSPEITLAYLACLQENIPVVVVCPTTPPVRLTAIVRNCGATCCIHAKADQALAETLALPLFCVSSAWSLGEMAAPPICASRGVRGNPAYILYTSGSSGEPKGVVISPGALASYALAAKAAYASAGPFNAPLFTSFAFDLTQTSILVPVLSGGFIQTHELDIRDDPSLLRTLLADESLTAIKCTPAHLMLLIEHGTKPHNPITCVVGGENLSSALASKALQFFPPGSRIINEYGPTEATVGCCVYEVSARNRNRVAADNAITPIGEALGAAEMSVRDAFGQRVPDGFHGEIWIGGPVLADGYVGSEASTETKFVCDSEHRRWYRTGDLGLRDSGGNFHCLGRVDDELKLRGQRIHPAEIEKAVATVLAMLSPDGADRALKALKLIVDGSETVALCSSAPVPDSNPEFQRALKERIPDAWLPGVYCTVHPWPINANGKADMPALVAAARASLALVGSRRPGFCGENRAGSRRAYELPGWLDAAFLRPIWSDGVDFNRSFLELGGDSIKAIRLVALLAREGVRIGANELLTVSALGHVLEKACARVPDEVSTGAGIPEQVDANWLRHLPSVRWLQEQPLTDVDRFQQCVALELLPSVSPERANTALAAVEARHQVFALRANRELTDFHFSSSEPELPQPYVLEPGERVDHRWRRLQGEVCLAKRPSIHEVVIDPQCGKVYLLWICHHLLCDVHTWIYLLDELEQALGEAAEYAGSHPEYGVFLWGKWLRRDLPEAQPPRQGDIVIRRGAVTVAMTVSVSNDRFRSMEQRYKADRAQLIAAALLEVARHNGTLPDEPAVLFESHGRAFTEAGVPAAWGTHLANAAGWFTGFTRVNVGDCAARQHGFLRALKLRLHQISRDAKQDPGAADSGRRPMICINDIGSGLSAGRSWRHFKLLEALSGGARHPSENSLADFELLVQDVPESGSVCVELRLGTPAADVKTARSYLTQLSDTLSVWDRRPPLALTPEDFPLCRLTQAELDAIVNGALA